MITTIAIWAFVICALIVFYVWFGYGALALALCRWKSLRHYFPLPDGFGEVRINPLVAEQGVLPDRAAERGYMPMVSLIVAAWNEQEWVDPKVANSKTLDYPKELLEIIFVTDGSTDETVERLRRHQDIVVYHQHERRGKIAAVNRVVPMAKGEILIFNDANSMLNPEAVRLTVRHFAHQKVACVAGEKRVMDTGDSSSGKGEGLYWRYESALKKLDSQLWSVVGAAGEMFAIRKSLYRCVEENALIEDFLISVRLVADGYRAVYEPNAVASEAPSANVREEFRRKVRISAGGFQSVVWLWPLWRFWRHGLFGVSYWCHRAFRWVLAPPAFFLMLPLGVIIALTHQWFWPIPLAQ
ncbi:MAG: glycosyltransferase family 2 protein, partial [Candidatus Sumerlaeota bacterium]|nr:glycosyltransferase family 2 protein [Candidatus Sumerlaeota bacterium]